MKDFFIFNSLNIFSLIILVLLYLQAKNYYDNEATRVKKLWIASLVFVFIAHISDILCWAFSGVSGHEARVISYIVNSLYFIFIIIFSCVLSAFVEYNINYSDKAYKFLKKIFTPIIILNTVLTVLSIPFKWYYFLDQGNNYIRGPLNFVSIVLAFFPFVFVYFRILFIYKENSLNIKSVLTIGMLISFGFNILQFTGISPVPVLLPSVTLVILFLYLFLMNNSIYTDDLTGLQNKRGVNKYFDVLPAVLNNYLAVIFIDINNLKTINDVYGHKEGDFAILAVSKIISKTVRKNDLTARLGGDEFLIVSIINNEDEASLIINRLNEELNIHNINSSKEYSLSISCGVSIALPDVRIDKERIISDADKRMYEQKNKGIQGTEEHY